MVEAEKFCPRCSVVKAISEFTIRESGPRLGQAVAHCKVCNARMFRERKKCDTTVYRRIEWPSKLKRLYGISVDEYYMLLAKQGGGCAICAARIPGMRHYKRNGRIEMFHVDHCHSTGKVRGLLCSSCNRAIGLLRDDPDLALRVSQYLSE